MKIEFTACNTGEHKVIGVYDMPCVPRNGEYVVIGDHGYIVHETTYHVNADVKVRVLVR